MSSASPQPELSPTDLWNSFDAFPTPLALFDEDGRAIRVNAKFVARYGEEGIDGRQLAATMNDPHDGWRDVGPSMTSAGQPARARAVRTFRHILLVIDESEGAQDHPDLVAMRDRMHELERLATTDYLTGAWNRAHLDAVIDSELARSLASRQPLSLVLLDVDHFKTVNDRFGHSVGDSVLRELVQLVRSRTRASDVLFRWGGEEFVVLVPVGYRGAERVAHNIREAVATHVFDGAGALTVSLGVTEHAGDEDAVAWFRRTDEALYEAKAAGRNRVVVARRGNTDDWAAAGGASALHLVWQEGYECGNPTIDDEHRELFRLANRLIAVALTDSGDPTVVASALDELLTHAAQHFTNEEAILERLQYAALPQHRRAHAWLLKRARYMKDLLEQGSDGSLGALVEFLAQDVVARHLMVVDRAFLPLFQSDGSGS